MTHLIYSLTEEYPQLFDWLHVHALSLYHHVMVWYPNI